MLLLLSGLVRDFDRTLDTAWGFDSGTLIRFKDIEMLEMAWRARLGMYGKSLRSGCTGTGT